MRKLLVIALVGTMVMLAGFLMESCNKPGKEAPVIITFPVPPGFPAPQFDFTANPLTEEGFVLGRKLFHDGRLSKDGMHSCASCHQPIAAFTTFEHDRSHGYNNSHTLRNAPGLFNLAWYPYFNQDGGEEELAQLFTKHIEHPEEMADHLREISRELSFDADYKAKFKAAFGTDEINSTRILHALKQFVLSLVSAHSKYDRVKRGEDAFSGQEAAGYTLFQQHCSTCHKEPLFTDFSFRNTGLPVDPLLRDHGRKRITGLSEDSLKFRVPSLRNLEFTSYYTHDGRFSLPRHVIQHYRFGVQPSHSLDPLLANGIALTDAEETQLVAFLRTLSDSVFLTDPRWRE